MLLILLIFVVMFVVYDISLARHFGDESCIGTLWKWIKSKCASDT